MRSRKGEAGGRPRRSERRAFLRGAALLGAGALAGSSRRPVAFAAPAILSRAETGRTLAVGVVGLGRGMDHVRACLEIPGISVAYVCDVDRNRLAQALEAVKKAQEEPCAAVGDFRRILDDKAVDALSIATCNHWHAPATVLACKAGKHVYVEKPGSHNAREAELIVEAAKKHGRVVQMGNQRRSWPGIIEGIEKLRAGAIGTVRYARSWYTNRRPSIGRGKEGPPPAHLDWELWQGPAPERPYKDNLVHYNWHWHWHWGGGELANNGVHGLDLLRWGLAVDYPKIVSYTGGRYRYDDDQETPDTGIACYDFGTSGAAWEHTSSHQRKPESPEIAVFYGDAGRLALDGTGYAVYDLDGKETGRGTGPSGDRLHFEDFFDAIRTGRRPRSDIEDGQKSALLCHLGNIAYRLGQAIRFDPETRSIAGPEEARRLWGREYRPGWEPAP